MRVSELPPDGSGGWADMDAVRLDDAGLCWLNTDATLHPKQVLGECVKSSVSRRLIRSTRSISTSAPTGHGCLNLRPHPPIGSGPTFSLRGRARDYTLVLLR